MAWSGRERHRDREPGRRQLEQAQPPARDRVFRITDDERQAIAESLRLIDEARTELEAQQKRENRAIVRELRASADRIFDIVNELEEA